MERLALEWMWRVVIDPWNKWERYLFGTPLFMWRVLQEKLK
jgi:N-acetylglucosaminyldiphosphoundecaprenol N-acetyl-beta-D-mannosaminyltransferase